MWRKGTLEKELKQTQIIPIIKPNKKEEDYNRYHIITTDNNKTTKCNREEKTTGEN